MRGSTTTPPGGPRVFSWGVLCHHFGIQSHSERIRGLRDALFTHGDGLPITDVLEGGDDSARSERLMVDALRRRPDVAGIYNAGAPNDAVRAALRRVATAHPPVFIGHELTADTRGMLMDGTMSLAIDQSPERQARHAIDALLAHFGYAGSGAGALAPAGTVPFTLHGPYNIDG